MERLPPPRTPVRHLCTAHPLRQPGGTPPSTHLLRLLQDVQHQLKGGRGGLRQPAKRPEQQAKHILGEVEPDVGCVCAVVGPAGQGTPLLLRCKQAHTAGQAGAHLELLVAVGRVRCVDAQEVHDALCNGQADALQGW